MTIEKVTDYNDRKMIEYRKAVEAWKISNFSSFPSLAMYVYAFADGTLMTEGYVVAWADDKASRHFKTLEGAEIFSRTVNEEIYA